MSEYYCKGGQIEKIGLRFLIQEEVCEELD